MSLFNNQTINPQELAANSIKDNIIVSASAGTGKTWTLVQRVMNHILNDDLNIWQVLAVTFTEKAAQELKDRIRTELSIQQTSCTDPKLSKKLLNCIYLLPLAQFSTIHSLCSVIIRENFSLIDTSPKIMIVEGLKQKKIRRLAWEKVCKRSVENKSDIQLISDTARWLCNGEMLRLFEAIDELDKFMVIQSHPKQNDFIELCLDSYNFSVSEPSSITNSLKSNISNDLKKYSQKLKQLEKSSEAIDYLPWINDWLAITDDTMQKMESINSYIDLFTLFQSVSLTPQVEKMLRVKNPYEPAKNIINAIKGLFKQLKTDSMIPEPTLLAELVKFNLQLVKNYFELWRQWRCEYQILKHNEGVVDFNDLEHFAYQLLSQYPSVREKYQNQYRAILVDEYQDTNPLQEDILSMLTVSKEGSKAPVVFRVGDVKQSIYRFRGAEPNIFNSHIKNAEGNTNRLVTLSHNRRSSANILSAINFIFSILMTEENAETDYKKHHELLICPEKNDKAASKPVELWFIDSTCISQYSDDDESNEIETTKDTETDSEDSIAASLEELHSLELEGRMIGIKLKQLVESDQEVVQSKSGITHTLKYSDCVILMRNMQLASALVRGLETVGVPVYALLRKGFVNSVEVRDTLNLLSCIDNPCSDLALVGWLTSPAVGLTIAELTHVVKCTSKMASQPLYLRLIKYCQEIQGTITEKINRSNAVLEELRELMHLENPVTLLHLALYKSGLIYAAQMSPYANQKLANLKLLLDLAVDYTSEPGVGLRGLLEYYTELTRSDEVGPAPAIGEGENVVRVMSVHQSKGLEFPVVIVAGLSQNFYFSNQKGIAFSQKYGLATKLIDSSFTHNYRWPLIDLVRKHEKQRMLAEELRILYVALTRAKYRLVLSGFCDFRRLAKWFSEFESDLLDADMFFNTKSELHWLFAVFAQHPQLVNMMNEKLESCFEANHQLFALYPNSIQVSWSDWQAIELIKPQKFELHIPEFKPIEQKIQLPTSFVFDTYPAKMNVTDIIRAGEDEESEVFFPVSFGEGSSDALRLGIVYHKAFEILPLILQLDSVDVVRKQIESFSASILSQEDKELLDPNLIAAFYKTELGQYILANPSRVKSEISLTFAPAADSQYSFASIVQGRLDMLIETAEGNWIILDFKTDRVVNQEKVDHYQKQLAVYAEMITSATNRQVEAIYLHFVRKGENGLVRLGSMFSLKLVNNLGD